MTPAEQQLIEDLFARMQRLGSVDKDAAAERLINNLVRDLPDAPYLLVQSVLVQEEALRKADARIRQLEAQVAESADAPGKSFLTGSQLTRGSVPSAGSTRPAPPPAAEPLQPEPARGGFLADVQDVLAEGQKRRLQQRAEEVSQRLEMMEAESQRRLEEERVAQQAKVDAQYQQLANEERASRDKAVKEQGRLQIRADEMLRERQNDLEKAFQARRQELETRVAQDEERRAMLMQEWNNQRDRAQIDLDNQRMMLDEAKASKSLSKGD